MTQLAANHPLVSRIAGLRRRARLLLALYGAGYVLMTVMAGILVLVIADYFLHFDSAASRLALLSALAAAVAAVAWTKLISPLSTRLTDQFLASRVELVNKTLADELMSALQFIRQDAGRENVFAARVVASAQERAAGMKFERALRLQTAGKAVTAGAVVAALLVILGLINAASGKTAIAFARWTNPFGGVPWPHMQDVEFDWSAFPGGKAPAVLPQGEPVTITLKVTRGFEPSMIASLYFSSDTEREKRDLMTLQDALSRDGVGIYQEVITASGNRSITLRAVAGDYFAQTQIALAPRPSIGGLKAIIQPPQYVTGEGSAPRGFDLQQESARAVEGSMVHLLAKSTKPLDAPNGTPAVTIIQSGRDEALPVEGLKKTLIDPYDADLSFVADKSMEFRIQMRDTDGFTNTPTATMRLDVAPDAMPSVMIVEPRREVQAVSGAEVKVKINVSDDMGLSELYLRADNYDAKAGDPPRFSEKLPIDNLVADGAAHTVVGSTTYLWKLAGLDLKPGDRLTLYALVRDNYAMTGPAAGKGENFEVLADDMVHHKMVRSASLMIVIKSKDEIITDATKTLEHLAAEIQQVHDLQKTTRQKTQVLQKAISQGGVTSQQQADLQSLAQDETNETQRSAAIQQKIEQVRETLKTNKMDDEPVGQLAQRASDVMKDVSQQDMPKATGDLNQAKNAVQNAQQSRQKNDQRSGVQSQQQAQDAAQDAAAQEQTAEDKLQALAKEIQDKGMLAQMMQKVGDLQKRTEDAQAREKSVATTSQGKSPEELTPQEKNAQAQIAQEQKELAKEQRDLEKQLADGQKDLQKSNPSAAQAMGQAAQTSQKQEIAQKQEQAAQSAQQNQTNGAQQQQQQAGAGLAEMQRNLQDAQKYERDRIAAEVADLLKSVTRLRTQQDDARSDAQKAGDKAPADTLSTLGDRESRMNLTLVTLRDRSAALPDGEKIAADLKDAQGGMQDATGSLYKSQQPPAVSRETDTLAALDAAIKKLQAADDRNKAEQAKNDLAEIRKQFEVALKKEQALRDGTKNIAQHVQNLGTLPAVDQSKLGAMAADQGEVASNVSTLTTGKLQQFEEYVWMTNQIVDFMSDSKNRLAKAETGVQVTLAQDSAITRLSSIIEALKEEEAEKDKFLKDQAGGGGGGGGGQKPLIPPLAELKLLKQAQLQTDQDTLVLNKAMMDATNDGDKADLRRQAQRVGEEQNQVRDLTQKVIDKLSH